MEIPSRIAICGSCCSKESGSCIPIPSVARRYRSGLLRGNSTEMHLYWRNLQSIFQGVRLLVFLWKVISLSWSMRVSLNRWLRAREFAMWYRLSVSSLGGLESGLTSCILLCLGRIKLLWWVMLSVTSSTACRWMISRSQSFLSSSIYDEKMGVLEWRSRVFNNRHALFLVYI